MFRIKVKTSRNPDVWQQETHQFTDRAAAIDFAKRFISYWVDWLVAIKVTSPDGVDVWHSREDE